MISHVVAVAVVVMILELKLIVNGTMCHQANDQVALKLDQKDTDQGWHSILFEIE